MKAVIVSAQRSGGLWLAGCLSNHPDVHCPREEPFRRESIWQQGLDLSPGALLDFVLSEPYYSVTMCRLTYDQAFHPEIREYLLHTKVRIVHLTRAVMPTVTSTLLAKLEMARGVPRHDFEGRFVDDEVLDVGPEVVVKRIKHLLKQRLRFREQFAGTTMFDVRYESLVGGKGRLALNAGARLCGFLGIEPLVQVMTARNRKMHRRPVMDYYVRSVAITRVIESIDWGLSLW